jgi:hypothetical protein
MDGDTIKQDNWAWKAGKGISLTCNREQVLATQRNTNLFSAVVGHWKRSDEWTNQERWQQALEIKTQCNTIPSSECFNEKRPVP